EHRRRPRRGGEEPQEHDDHRDDDEEVEPEPLPNPLLDGRRQAREQLIDRVEHDATEGSAGRDCYRRVHQGRQEYARTRFTRTNGSSPLGLSRLVESGPVTTVDLDLVVLGGGGHVGLPLSLAFAEAGQRVGIYDINQHTLDRIGRGEMPFKETGADELLPKVLKTGRLELSSDASMLGRTNVVVVVVGTPVDEFLGPSMSIFEKTVEQIAPHLRHGALV